MSTGLINEKQSSAMHNDYSFPVPAKRDSDIIDLAKFTIHEQYMSFMINDDPILYHIV